MFLGIDHLVIAIDDPAAAVARLEAEAGLASASGGRHEALGTFNRLVWLGDTYLEFIGVFDRALAETSWVGRPTVRTLDDGGGLATWAVATDDLDADLSRLRARGSNLGDPLAGNRQRPDGAMVRWRLAAPTTLGPEEPPFLIEHDQTAAEWTPADRAARAAMSHPLGGPVTLQVLELAVDDPGVVSQRFARTVGLQFRPSLAGRGARDANVGAQIVRLRPRRYGRGSTVMHLRAPVQTEATVDLFGCRWMLSPAG